MRQTTFRAGLLATTLILLGGGASAQAPQPGASGAAVPRATTPVPPGVRGPVPDIGASVGAQSPGVPPVLRFVIDQGARLTSLGELRPGVIGYLAESANGKFQTFYVLDDQTILAGLAFRLGNQAMAALENVTAAQVVEMQRRIDVARNREEEVRRRNVELAEQAQRRVEEAMATNRDRLSELAGRTAQAEAARRQVEAAAQLQLPQAPPSVSGGLRPTGGFPDVSAPTKPPAAAGGALPAAAGAAADPFLSPLNRAAFLGELEANPPRMMWFDLGPRDAPMVVMVADPTCEFCHRAWQVLRPMVQERRVRVRVVMIAGRPQAEAAAISILSREEPGRAFWNGEGSSTQPVQAPPPEGTAEFARGQNGLRLNAAFVDRFGQSISQTPFLAYVGADGQLRSTAGTERLDAFLRGVPPSRAQLPPQAGAVR